MNMSLSFYDLRVYKIASELAIEISKVVGSIPKSVDFCVGNQMTRASQSVMANIAEGYGRKRYKREFSRFLTFAVASCDELQSHLQFVHLRGWIKNELFIDLSKQSKNLSVRLSNFIQVIQSELTTD
jgi:four helix bundle protein